MMPFVSLNCAAVPENLLEATLFGTVRGAFTGSENIHGLIQKADGGVLFLDEIHMMPLNIQAKLLRFLEEHKIRRLGDSEDKFVNVRIISAMNSIPMAAIEKNLIREDLFFRLSVVSINVPPLRDRQTDIPLLVDHFIHYYNDSMHRSIEGVSDLVMNLFKEFYWKGNVRELRHVIEGAFNLSKGNVITLKELPDYMVDLNNTLDSTSEKPNDELNINLEQEVEAYEQGLICRAIDESSSYAEAARKLGITRQSLRYKIEKYSLNREAKS